MGERALDAGDGGAKSERVVAAAEGGFHRFDDLAGAKIRQDAAEAAACFDADATFFDRDDDEHAIVALPFCSDFGCFFMPATASAAISGPMSR